MVIDMGMRPAFTDCDDAGYGHNFSCQLELQQQESGDSIGRVRGIVQQINLRDGAGLSHKVRAHGPLCLPVPHLVSRVSL